MNYLWVGVKSFLPKELDGNWDNLFIKVEISCLSLSSYVNIHFVSYEMSNLIIFKVTKFIT